MHRNLLTRLIPAILLCAFSATTICTFDACAISQIRGEQSVKALEIFEKGRLNDAIVLAQTTAEENPESWQAHAVLGFLAWKQGDVILALKEAERASQLNPSSRMLENLAQMNEVLGDYAVAAGLYKQAILVSTDSVAGIGLARCYAKLPEKRAEALDTLAEMSSRRQKDANWYLQIADTYLQLGEARSAAQTVSVASKLVKDNEPRKESLAMLLLALLRDNQTEEARRLAHRFFSESNKSELKGPESLKYSKSYELYVLSALKLLRPAQVSSAKKMLDSAIASLTSREDADGFFRMGRIFQALASQCSADHRNYDAWIRLSESAYERACVLEPGQGRYHLALAGAMGRQGRLDKFAAELQEAKAFDQFDAFAPYLLSKLPSISSLKEGTPLPMNLTKVEFKLKGVNCSCHLSKIETTLAKQKAVAFASIERPIYIGNLFDAESEKKVQEYNGTLFVEPSADLSGIFSSCSQEFFPSETKQKSTFDFQIVGSSTLSGVDEAIRIAQSSKYLDPGHFVNQIRAVEPTLPLDLLQASSQNAKATF